MRGLVIFLSLFAASLLLFTLGVTTGTVSLLIAGIIAFIVLAAGLAVRVTSNVLDWFVEAAKWPSGKDD